MQEAILTYLPKTKGDKHLQSRSSGSGQEAKPRGNLDLAGENGAAQGRPIHGKSEPLYWGTPREAPKHQLCWEHSGVLVDRD
jgi:hypothetical protein